MQDGDKVIGTSDYNGTPLLVKDVYSGNFIKKRYIKCPHLEKKCKWLLAGKHINYSYLDDACYLSGSFNLDCPS
jgi:hypothetical protein